MVSGDKGFGSSTREKCTRFLLHPTNRSRYCIAMERTIPLGSAGKLVCAAVNWETSPKFKKSNNYFVGFVKTVPSPLRSDSLCSCTGTCTSGGNSSWGSTCRNDSEKEVQEYFTLILLLKNLVSWKDSFIHLWMRERFAIKCSVSPGFCVCAFGCSWQRKKCHCLLWL